MSHEVESVAALRTGDAPVAHGAAPGLKNRESGSRMSLSCRVF